MQEKGIEIDSATYTSLMHWLSNSGNVDEAVKMWEEMNSKGCYHTVVSYTAYKKILFSNDRVKEATDVYKEMLQSGRTPKSILLYIHNLNGVCYWVWFVSLLSSSCLLKGLNRRAFSTYSRCLLCVQ